MLASLERARESEQRFVADASHELRTPLTALRGNVAYVARHGADPAVLADLEADAARLAALLDDLLALAREDAAAPVRGEPVDLVEVARDGGRRRTPPPTRWSEPADGDGAVLAERPALERAVGNLVRNARAPRPARAGAITVAVGRDGDRARISVADEGPGLGARGGRARLRALLARAGGARRAAPASASRSCAPIAERHGGRVEVDGAALHDRPSRALRDVSNSGRRTPGAPF